MSAVSRIVVLACTALVFGGTVASARANPSSGAGDARDAGLKQDPTEPARAFWADWAKVHKYKFTTTKDLRILLMVPEERSRAEHTLELVEKSLARTDVLLPLLPKEAAMTTTPSPPAWTAEKEKEGPKEPVWGASDRPLETDTIVFAIFRKPGEYADALDRLAEAHPYLASWVAKGRDDPGCILERPLFGACVDSVAGMEEWNPDNEVVHRVGQLAMIRRCGRQPVWVGLGIGWNVEFDVLQSIYCFPWRNGFVSIGEHGGWEADLRRAFGRREKKPLTIDELAGIKRGNFDATQAGIAWGTIRFLAQNHAAALPKLLAELNHLHETLGKVPTADGKHWTMAADFEVPVAEQQGAIDRTVGAGTLQQVTEWFRLGKKWKKTAKAGK